MARLNTSEYHEPRDYRKAGEHDHISEPDTSGRRQPSTLDTPPRIPSSSDVRDGWVDAGAEQQESGGHAASTASDAFASLSLMDSGGLAASTTALSTSQPSVPPLKPQNTNNPFLHRKNSSSADGLQTPQAERSHADAWAELIPRHDELHPSSYPAQESSMEYSSHNTESLPGNEVHAGSKGKEPDLARPNPHSHQDDDVLDQNAGRSGQKVAPQPDEEYEPPPGPPPGRNIVPGVLPGPPPPKNETYQIKHIRWLDYASGEQTRKTPILMQNLNGPCPLLALVNALTLSAPRTHDSALVEALRSREQVSLGLLLDAVVEELITNRMADQGALPDMIELYDFLKALHTGMNVNPAFVSTTDIPNLIDFEPNSPSASQKSTAPGGFEKTKEMKLYSTFTIPLVHGWLPPRSHPAYAALERSARTHEDAENLLTREDELEEKLVKDGLSEDEQRLLEDIGTIKYFLESSATQLTGHGLDAITDTITNGSFAILFRNNHFSTLHKHPLTGSVFSLVTDMGYIKYPEIVWESLVDTNGLGAELFSGDFRAVSHGSTESELDVSPQRGRERHDELPSSTQALPGRSDNLGGADSGSLANTAETASYEQEDADLALALQLQEEEDQRHRRGNPPPRAGAIQTPQPVRGHRSSTGRRSGSTSLSHATTPRAIAMRGNVGNTSGVSPRDRPSGGPQPNNSPFPATVGRRPIAPRRDPDGPADEPPPPSYESALEENPYVPPESSHHHHSSPIPSPSVANRNAQGTAVDFDSLIAQNEGHSAGTRPRLPSQSQNGAWNQMSGSRRTRGSIGNVVGSEDRRDKDCMIM